MFRKILKNKNFKTVIYKLSIDALFLSLALFFILFIINSVLPGIISDKIGFSILSLPIVISLLISVYLGKELDFQFDSVPSKKILIVALIIFAMILFLTMRNFSWVEIIISIAVSLGVVITLYKEEY